MFSYEVVASFNDLENAIYTTILENENISSMTIKELAQLAHVSVGTVQRFCKHLGFDGYSHFKIAYKEYLKNEQIILNNQDNNSLKLFIDYTEQDAFLQLIMEAVAILKNVEQIVFVGIGSSGTLGRYGARYFSNIGKFSMCIEDPWQPVLQNSMEKTCVIALSESGETSQTLKIVQKLKEKGCPVIAITNTLESTLSRLSDCSITYHVPQLFLNGFNITTQVPVILIIEMLMKQLYTTKA